MNKADVLAACRGQVSALVRRYVPAAHREEGEQVGAVGVLIALERYDTSLAFDERFWPFAFHYVRDEIQRWLGEGVYWRKSPNRGKSTARQANRDAARVHAVPASMDAELSSGGPNMDRGRPVTLHDLVSATVPIADEQVIQAELNAKLSDFLGTLTGDERRLLLCEKRERVNGGVEKGNNVRARHYLSLVERASAFVRGKDDVDGTGTEGRKD